MLTLNHLITPYHQKASTGRTHLRNIHGKQGPAR